MTNQKKKKGKIVCKGEQNMRNDVEMLQVFKERNYNFFIFLVSSDEKKKVTTSCEPDSQKVIIQPDGLHTFLAQPSIGVWFFTKTG